MDVNISASDSLMEHGITMLLQVGSEEQGFACAYLTDEQAKNLVLSLVRYLKPGPEGDGVIVMLDEILAPEPEDK